MQRRELNAPKTPAGRDLLFTGHRSKRCHAYALHQPGQVGLDASGNLAEDFAAQCRQTLLNLEAQLRVAGMSFDNVVKLQTILPDLANIGELRRIRAEIMGDRKPASTLIVGGLVNTAYKIEIEAIACA
jgi:2-iminobutanoate/2-iminopropanoate deaminase